MNMNVLCVRQYWLKIKKLNKLNIAVWSYYSKRLLCGTHCFTIFVCDSVFHLIMVQTSKVKVLHTSKELIKVVAIKVTTRQSGIKHCNHWKKQQQKNKSDISYMSAELWDNITNFKAYSVVQCEVPAVKNTSLVDDDNDDSK